MKVPQYSKVSQLPLGTPAPPDSPPYSLGGGLGEGQRVRRKEMPDGVGERFNPCGPGRKCRRLR